MNTAMYENPVVQDNIRKLQTYGVEVIYQPAYLACRNTGPENAGAGNPSFWNISEGNCLPERPCRQKLLVTAGPTQAIDPVAVCNHSSEELGYAICKVARAQKEQRCSW